MRNKMRNTKWSWMLSALGVGFLMDPVAQAGGRFPSLPQMLDHEWQAHQVLAAERLMIGASVGRGLMNLSGVDRHDAIRGFLRSKGLHPMISLVEHPSDRDVGSSGLGLAQASPLIVREYSLRAGRYEICKSSIRTVETPDGVAHVLGVSPSVDAVYPVTDDAWISSEESLGMARKSLEAAGVSISGLFLTHSSRCLFPVQSELQPVWKVILRSGSTPYLLYVGSSGVIEGDVMAFDASATVRAYDTNPSTGTLKDFTVTVSGNGYMTNDYFTTADGDSGGQGRMNSGSNSFTNAPGNYYFAEQSVFAHVNVHRDFSETSGYVWKGPKPMTVAPHYTFTSGVNNAQYTPFDGSQGPFILVGDGDGTVLQNLPYDADVVSHEFGHHVVYGSITTVSGESLVLHEGLADAITFMRTGNACLGESICPAASSLCQVKGQCLRTGENTLKYNSDAYKALSSKAHLQGQLISGFFWDLRKGGQIPSGDLNKILINAITYLPSSASIAAFITSVLDADYALYKAQYQKVILDAASARGMGIDTLNIPLSSIDGEVNSAAAGGGAVSDDSKSGKKGFLGLCSIGAEAASSSSAAWIIAGLMLPILVHLLGKSQPVRVKARKK